MRNFTCPATGSSAADLTRRLLRSERALVACSILLLAALCWAYLLRGMPMSMMQPPLSALILMWWLMMLAMMLPSATPAILLYARVRQARGDAAIAQTWAFIAGYLLVWLLFSIAAAFAQALVTRTWMPMPGGAARSAILIAAGVYQLSPFKSACLGQCRSPAQFITRHWRPGWGGATRLGALHGAYCVGCCWMIMTLLFVGGVMNLVWIVGLAVLVASEKLLPIGKWVQRLSGVGLIAWGVSEAFN